MKSVYIAIALSLVANVLSGVAIFRPAVVERIIERQIGASPGPSVSGNEFTIGGVTYFAASTPFATATNTICSLRAPTNATSTLVHFGVNMRTTIATTSAAGSGNPGIVVAKDTGKGPTTTPMGVYLNIRGADLGKNYSVIASTSPGAVAADANVFGPGNYANVKVANSAAGDFRGYAPEGHCMAIWVVNHVL